MHANHREDIDSIGAGRHRGGRRSCPTRARATRCATRSSRSSSKTIMFPEPVISQAIEPKTKADQDKLGTALSRLAQEDPTFRMRTDEETQQTIIAGMGELHLEIILDRLKREFKVEANVGKPQVAYKEAITKSSKSKAASSASRAAKVSTATFGFASSRASRAAATCSSRRSSAASCPRNTSSPSARAFAKHRRPAALAGLSRARLQGDAVRRQLPRRGLIGNGLQDRRLHGVQGSQSRRWSDHQGTDHGASKSRRRRSTSAKSSAT